MLLLNVHATMDPNKSSSPGLISSFIASTAVLLSATKLLFGRAQQARRVTVSWHVRLTTNLLARGSARGTHSMAQAAFSTAMAISIISITRRPWIQQRWRRSSGRLSIPRYSKDELGLRKHHQSPLYLKKPRLYSEHKRPLLRSHRVLSPRV